MSGRPLALQLTIFLFRSTITDQLSLGRGDCHMDALRLSDQVDKLMGTLETIEGRLAGGEVPREGLEDLKRAVDNIRHTVWALLSAAESSDDYEVVIARFRLNRTAELCQQVALGSMFKMGIILFSGRG